MERKLFDTDSAVILTEEDEWQHSLDRDQIEQLWPDEDMAWEVAS